MRACVRASLSCWAEQNSRSVELATGVRRALLSPASALAGCSSTGGQSGAMEDIKARLDNSLVVFAPRLVKSEYKLMTLEGDLLKHIEAGKS